MAHVPPPLPVPTLPLQIAVDKLLSDGLISENPIREAVAAVSAGVVVYRFGLGLSRRFRLRQRRYIIMTASGKIIEIKVRPKAHRSALKN